MTLAAPTMVALETDSAWLVILGVSFVTLPATLLLRRLIGRPGGVSSGVVLALPLLLPLLSAVVYQHAVLPEISVLRPATPAVLERPGDLLSLFWFSSGRGATPYALAGSAGPWLLLFGLSLTAFVFVRRAVGHVALRRVLRRCRPLDPAREVAVAATFARLASSLRVRRVPPLLVLPASAAAFTTGGRVVVGERLIERLDPPELEGVLAHELAHVAAHDVPIVVTAGFLRDVVAWNPFAHVAFRRLAADREFEADRRAAAATGNPLAVASGLVKMCELGRGGGRRRGHAALAFLRPGARVSRRVSHLLLIADGRAVVTPAAWLPYALAACLVASLGLGVGARIARDDGAALAFVWGETTSHDAPVWTASRDGSVARRGLAQGHERAQRARHHRRAERGPRVRRLPLHAAQLAEATPVTIREKDIPKFVDALEAAARRRGVQLRLQQGWQAEPVFSGDTGSSFGVFTVEQLP
ncbi:MAG TPA: M56 family metallopeptidase [Actinomycetota bacterium]|nr:M56 family metallopeptidase [Actinomycetota bacterium]